MLKTAVIDGICYDGSIYFSTKNIEKQTFSIYKIDEISENITPLKWADNSDSYLVPYKFIEV